MHITQRYLLNQKRPRSTRRLKHLQWQPFKCGSKPYKKKRTARSLKTSILQPIKLFLQSTKNIKEKAHHYKALAVRLSDRYRKTRESPFIMYHNHRLRCWKQMKQKAAINCSFFVLCNIVNVTSIVRIFQMPTLCKSL